MLGRYPSIAGRMLPDMATIGLDVDPGRALPDVGVYAAFAVLGSDRVPAMASFGVDLGLEGSTRTVEVQFLDPDSDIQGCELTVELVSRLRDALPSQMESDQHAARRILKQVQGKIDTQAPPPEARQYWFREQEHTADRALRVWGKDMADLFVGAAHGMCDLMGDVRGVVPQAWRTLRLEAGDREGLLVEWLNELLFLNEQEGLLFTDFCIESLGDAAGTAQASLATVTLVIRVGGVVAPITGAHIKAATFHDLELIEGETGWSAVITFDV